MAAIAEVSRKSTRTRLVELDILRGFLLLWMTLTHLPTKVSILSNQTFGFVSGAEGFIFLAGFMIGQLENRIEAKRGREATYRDVGKRMLRVYFYHALLLVIAFTLVAAVGTHYHRLALENLLSFYIQHRGQAIAAAALLVYRPSLLDILPMYVIYLGLTPLARAIARRWGWDPVVYTSFAIWAAAQFGLRHFLYRAIDIPYMVVPEDSIGAFDMYAWQFLWMVGLALGTIYSEQLSERETSVSAAEAGRIPSWLFRLSVFIAAVFLLLRYSPVDRWMNPDSYGFLIDKWHLGPARVINFAAIAIVLVRYGQRLAALPVFAPLASLGRSSIEVFSVHVLCCLWADSLSHDADPILPWWQQIVVLAVTLVALFTTAQLHQFLSQRGKRAPA